MKPGQMEIKSMNIQIETVMLKDGSRIEVAEALKECEYALQHVLRNGKVGWLQEQAHKTARAVLAAQKQIQHTNRNNHAPSIITSGVATMPAL